MNIKKALLIGTIFVLLPIVMFLLTLKLCTGEIGCLILAFIPLIPATPIAKLFGINEATRIFGIAAGVYLSIIGWFLVGFLGTLLVQWIKNKVKK